MGENFSGAKFSRFKRLFPQISQNPQRIGPGGKCHGFPPGTFFNWVLGGTQA